MADRLNITVKDSGTHDVVARFRSSMDAQAFAAAVTANPEDPRELDVTDRAGYINLHYANGGTLDIW